MLQLSGRLQAVAQFVPSGTRLADIGTDHAYLPMQLLQNGRISYAVAGEVCQGPYCAAKKTIADCNATHCISLRLGDGFSVLTPGEVDTVVIAGMGSMTMINILKKCPEVTASIRRLILQPMAASAALRSWLITHGWVIVDESLVRDEGKLYEIIVAEPGESPAVEPVLLEIGPILWWKKPSLLMTHIDQLIARNVRILAKMAESETARHSLKYAEYKEKIRLLEEKRECLLNAR